MNGSSKRRIFETIAIAVVTMAANHNRVVSYAQESGQSPHADVAGAASTNLQSYAGSWNVNGQRLSLKVQQGTVLGIWAAGGGFEAVPIAGHDYLQGTWRQGRAAGGFLLKLSENAMQIDNLGWYGAKRNGNNEFRWTGRRIGPAPRVEEIPVQAIPEQPPQDRPVVMDTKQFKIRAGATVLAKLENSWTLVELMREATSNGQYEVVDHGRRGDSFHTVAADRLIPLIEPDTINITRSEGKDVIDQIAGHYYGTSGRIDNAAAKQLILQSSTDGNPLGQMWEAACRQRSRCGFRKDEELAQKIATSVIDKVVAQAKQGDANALYLWGIALHDGLGVDQDKAAAIDSWQTALDAGSSLPATRLAWLKGKNGEWSDAFRLRLRAALAGNVVAITALGNMYEDLNQPDLALRYFSKSASLGDPTAMTFLGFEHSRRNDVARAAELYLAAAEAGSPAAMSNLGTFYLHGKGVEKDLEEAEKWFLRGAELGEWNAAHNLGVLHYNAERYDKAVVWYRRAAEAGVPAAMNNYGLMLFDGTGVVRNRDEGEKWLAKAAKAGVAAAKKYFSARDNAATSYGVPGYGAGSAAASEYSQMQYELNKLNVKMQQQFNQNVPGFQPIPPHAMGIR